jgi:hypothetical protein
MDSTRSTHSHEHDENVREDRSQLHAMSLSIIRTATPITDVYSEIGWDPRQSVSGAAFF